VKPAAKPSDDRPYHHGNLRSALIDEAMALARSGGPDAVVLREVARRAGVSSAAAYRHFASHDDLLDAVKHRALEGITEAIRREVDAREAGAAEISRAPATRARGHLLAIGRGYLRFAFAEPGLYRTAFSHRGTSQATSPASRPTASANVPYRMLAEALDELVTAGALPEAWRPGSEYVAWATVHGLAMLCLEGPLRGLPISDRDTLVDQSLDAVLRSLSGPPALGYEPGPST
jgi:AcrR family transcriptional regulator